MIVFSMECCTKHSWEDAEIRSNWGDAAYRAIICRRWSGLETGYSTIVRLLNDYMGSELWLWNGVFRECFWSCAIRVEQHVFIQGIMFVGFCIFFGHILQCLLRNLNNAVFRADGELVDTSSTQAGVTSGTSDSDNPRIPTMQAHVAGTCRPCVFHPTTRGCPKGDLCAYCHINHPRTMMERRVRKRTRDKIKRKLLEILNPPVDLETWRPFLDDFFFWSESDSGFFHSFLELCWFYWPELPRSTQ